jgi:deoxyribonuclease V
MTITLDIPNVREITLGLLLQIPKGRVTTYRALALALGDAIAVRAIGQILAENDQPDVYPCYKVVHSDGRVGAYRAPGGPAEKIARLQADGVPVQEGCIPHLQEHVFHQFETSRPLVRLRQRQEELSQRVCPEPLRSEYQTVGGVDLAYRGPWLGVGAYIGMEIASERPLTSEIAQVEISFPYIPTYLAFRELPVLLPLLERVKSTHTLTDVLMVDGSGILHPRHVGIASHLGVLLDVPTIGVTKSLLYGEVNLKDMKPKEMRSIVDPKSREVIGAAIKTRERADPIFVSIGHGIDLDTAVALVLKLSHQRLPEPIHRAHRVSKEAAHPREEFQGQRSLNL